MKHRIIPIGLALSLLTLGACGDDDDDGLLDDDDTGADTGTGTTGDDTADTTTDDTTDDTADGTTTGDDTTTTADTGTGTETGDTGTGTTGGEEASIRVMHLGVNVPAVDIFANMTGPVFENLEFGNSTEYAMVPAGDLDVEVFATGTTDPVLLEDTFMLDAGTQYTAVAIGDAESMEAATEPSLIALVDDSEGIDAGNVRLQVVHAAPEFGQVDIYETSGDAPVVLLTDVDFGASATLDMDLVAGPYTIGLDVDDDMMADVEFDVDTTDVANQAVNVYASNDTDGNAILVLQLDDGTTQTIMPTAG